MYILLMILFLELRCWSCALVSSSFLLSHSHTLFCSYLTLSIFVFSLFLVLIFNSRKQQNVYTRDDRRSYTIVVNYKVCVSTQLNEKHMYGCSLPIYSIIYYFRENKNQSFSIFHRKLLSFSYIFLSWNNLQLTRLSMSEYVHHVQLLLRQLKS